MQRRVRNNKKYDKPNKIISLKVESIENPIIGDKITFVNTAEQTNGEKTLLEILLAPKGGNTMH